MPRVLIWALNGVGLDNLRCFQTKKYLVRRKVKAMLTPRELEELKEEMRLIRFAEDAEKSLFKPRENKFKIINLTQQNVTPELAAVGVFEPRAKKTVQKLLTFETMPDIEGLSGRADRLAEIAAATVAEAALISGAQFFMTHLEDALEYRGLPSLYIFNQSQDKGTPNTKKTGARKEPASSGVRLIQSVETKPHVFAKTWYCLCNTEGFDTDTHSFCGYMPHGARVRCKVCLLEQEKAGDQCMGRASRRAQSVWQKLRRR